MFSAACAYIYYVNRNELNVDRQSAGGAPDDHDTMQFVRALGDCLASAGRARGVGVRLAGAAAAGRSGRCCGGGRVVFASTAAEVVTWTTPAVVKAGEFTAYLDAPAYSRDAPPDARPLDVLIECRRPARRQGDRAVSDLDETSSTVKLTDLCRPVAWRPGSPFGILATCTLDQLLDLARAFARHALAIDDDIMEIECITCVMVEGVPRQLLATSCEPASAGDDRSDWAPEMAAVAYDEVDRTDDAAVAGCVWIAKDSNVGGGSSSSSVPCTDLRKLADDDVPLDVALHHHSGRSCRSTGHRQTLTVGGSDGDGERHAEVPPSCPRPSAGQLASTSSSLSEEAAQLWSSSSLDDVESASVDEALAAPGDAMHLSLLQPGAVPATVQRSPNPKPPNVLVCAGGSRPSERRRQPAATAATSIWGDETADASYESTSALLDACLLPYSYAVYPLGADELTDGGRTPWADSCAALVLTPSASVPSGDGGVRFLVALRDYFLSGGAVVSLCSDVDRLLVSATGAADPVAELQPPLPLFETAAAAAGVYVTNVRTAGGGEFKAGLDVRHYGQQPRCCVSDAELRVVARDPSGNAVAVELSGQGHTGRAVLLRVHAEMSPSAAAAAAVAGNDSGGNHYKNILRDLIATSNARLNFLRDLLQSCGLRVSNLEGDTHQLQPTPCVLLAMDLKLHDDVVRAVKQCRRLQGAFNSEGSAFKYAAVEYVLRPDASTAPDAAFNWAAYAAALTSRHYGRVVLYQEISCTTQALIEPFMFDLPDHVCAVAIATRQTKGQGRGGNTWLSPPGCAMATLHMRVPLGSPLGQAPAFIQMVPAVAAAMAVRTLPGYENVNIKVKWPNDIYYGDHAKLGGVLVQSTLMGNDFHALVGFGINVSNHHPTCCINDAVAHSAAAAVAYGAAVTPPPTPLTVELVLARMVSLCEYLVDLFQRDKGAFIKLYYEYWLHSGSTVLVQEESSASAVAPPLGAAACVGGQPSTGAHRAESVLTEGRVEGVDEAGYLVVYTADGRRLSLQPDGNSFDIMRNLIIRKRL